MIMEDVSLVDAPVSDFTQGLVAGIAIGLALVALGVC